MTAPGAPDNPAIPDAPAGNLVDRYAPTPWKPFLRLSRIDRPIGWWLLLLPCWWSAALASVAQDRVLPDPWHCLLFLVGAVVMRGAGSTYNDLVDRDLDAQVARTRHRPLPSGQVTPKAAAAFMVAQALVGFLVLIQFNAFTIALGIASLAIVAAYPFMKRLIAMPQLVLGLAFAWGGLMGWAAAFGSLAWPAIALYAAAIAWTIGYDTIYAVQDLEDDAIVGIKSSARYFGRQTRRAVALCYGFTILFAGAAVAGAGAGWAGVVAVGAFAAHLGWQVVRIDPHDGRGALGLFRSNRDAGLIFFAGLSLAAFVSA